MKTLLVLLRGESFRLCTNTHNAKTFSYESTPHKQLETLQSFPLINHNWANCALVDKSLISTLFIVFFFLLLL